MIKKKNISQKDINTWEDYTKNPDDIVDKDKFLEQDNPKNQRFRYDLHGHNLIDANNKVKEIILSCVKKNYKEILLITGKGIHANTDQDIHVSKDLSILRFSMPEYIQSNLELSNHILSVDNAEKKDGGTGAIIIKLRKL